MAMEAIGCTLVHPSILATGFGQQVLQGSMHPMAHNEFLEASAYHRGVPYTLATQESAAYRYCSQVSMTSWSSQTYASERPERTGRRYPRSRQNGGDCVLDVLYLIKPDFVHKDRSMLRP